MCSARATICAACSTTTIPSTSLHCTCTRRSLSTSASGPGRSWRWRSARRSAHCSSFPSRGCPALTALADRGARSGIGIGAFEEGGFVVDGGRGAAAAIRRSSRAALPAAWRVLLVFDHGGRGLSGAAELAAFRALHAFPNERAAHLAHLVLMRVMPALVEQDFASFGDAIGEIQRDGRRLLRRRPRRAVHEPGRGRGAGLARAEGVAGVGQIVLGPDRLRASSIPSCARMRCSSRRASRFSHRRELEFAVARGRNHGHDCERLIDERAARRGPEEATAAGGLAAVRERSSRATWKTR